MNIGQAAKVSGVSAKMIRYYEQIGLINPAHRSDAGYRLYMDNDIHILSFIRSARDLGFSVEGIKDLLALWQDRSRQSADVKKIALSHIERLNEKISELQVMVHTLEHLVHCCAGDSRPNCPILTDLAQGHAHDAGHEQPHSQPFGVFAGDAGKKAHKHP